MRSTLLASVAAASVACSQAFGQLCGHWEPIGITDIQRGIELSAGSLVVFDDGTGPRIHFSANRIYTPKGIESGGIFRWGTSSWERAGPAGIGGALAVFDPGNGPALYAGSSQGVRRIEANSAIQLGDPFPVSRLAVHEENGPARLFAAGNFTTIGPSPVEFNHLAVWNGQAWEPVGGGIAGGAARIDAMLSHDDGSGPALYIGGDFITAGGPGGVAANGLARWRNSAWEAMSQGLVGEQRPVVRTLAAGPEGDLYAGGNFKVGTVFSWPRDHVARWDGTQWNALGDGLPVPVWSLQTFDNAMHAATRTSRQIVFRWDGASWQEAAHYGEGGHSSSLLPGIYSMAAHNDGSGEALYLAGEFGFINDTTVASIARLRNGIVESHNGSAAYIRGVETLDAGDGPALYIFGRFNTIGGIAANGIARWRNGQWESVGEGVHGMVYALTAGQLAGATERVLVASGVFRHAGTSPARHIAQWSVGNGWSEVGGGLTLFASNVLPHGVRGLRFHDDGGGGGTKLYVGGRFAGEPHEPRYLASWDGISWSQLGGAGSPSSSSFLVISNVASYGTDLYIAGFFSQVGAVQAATSRAGMEPAGRRSAQELIRRPGSSWFRMSAQVHCSLCREDFRPPEESNPAGSPHGMDRRGVDLMVVRPQPR